VPELTASFQENRRLLFTVAYEMLGAAADAEDVVQETWLRWSAADRSDVVEPRAYLVRITTRLALNRLRALRRSRETYVGPWLPDPLLTSPDAALPVERAEEVSRAMLVVLAALAPEVELVTDGGGVVRAARRIVRGADKVARALVAFARDETMASMELVPAEINGALGALYLHGGEPVMAAVSEWDGDRLARVMVFRNPERLAGLRGLTDLSG